MEERSERIFAEGEERHATEVHDARGKRAEIREERVERRSGYSMGSNVHHVFTVALAQVDTQAAGHGRDIPARTCAEALGWADSHADGFGGVILAGIRCGARLC